MKVPPQLIALVSDTPVWQEQMIRRRTEIRPIRVHPPYNLDALRTPDLFTQTRLLWLSPWTESEHSRAEWLQFFRTLPPSTTLVLSVSKLTKESVLHALPPSTIEILVERSENASWTSNDLSRLAVQSSLSLSPAQIESIRAILERNDVTDIDEAKKLLLLASAGGDRLLESAIQSLSGPDLFPELDRIRERPLPEALSSLDALERNGESPTALLLQLIREDRLINQAAALSRENAGSIDKELKLPRFVVDKLMRRMPRSGVRFNAEGWIELDELVKRFPMLGFGLLSRLVVLSRNGRHAPGRIIPM